MTPTRELMKALFGQLVTAAGGIEPSATVLGVSPERVSQLQRLSDLDKLPNVLHVALLESFVGQPVVTGYLARLATGGHGKDPMREAVEATEAATRTLRLVTDNASPKDICAAATRLKGEADDIIHAVTVDRA